MKTKKIRKCFLGEKIFSFFKDAALLVLQKEHQPKFLSQFYAMKAFNAIIEYWPIMVV